jgi:hypothetical protein
MRNKVEKFIQAGAFQTVPVASGQTLFIGQPVKVTADNRVSLAGAGEDALGIVYSGTVGLDGLNDGYKGDNGDVVTVIVLKPQVYLKAESTVTAGNAIEVGASGGFVPQTTGKKVATALTGATAGNDFIAFLG